MNKKINGWISHRGGVRILCIPLVSFPSVVGSAVRWTVGDSKYMTVETVLQCILNLRRSDGPLGLHNGWARDYIPRGLCGLAVLASSSA